MKNKRNKIIYLVSTILFTLVLSLGSITPYLFLHEFASEAFTGLGYPTYLIYPLAIAKALGLIAIWTKKHPVLKEWAYAGFFFNLLLATGAHIATNDGQFAGSLVVLILLLVSYFFEKKAHKA